MSEVLTHPSSLESDRPAEVTDPLLWNLALAVADTHEPDGNGGCRILLCADQPWPCAAWNSAQRALQAARATAPAASRRRPTTLRPVRAASAAA
ncbi:hypothetical protein ACTMSW_12470 [Micromonospora sp. BQ11]|uniref:hypothetical protein n=1 Tax=Micromonospora sp. BQ11 TaxID=3452212 RepID=UPI003F887C1D